MSGPKPAKPPGITPAEPYPNKVAIADDEGEGEIIEKKTIPETTEQVEQVLRAPQNKTINHGNNGADEIQIGPFHGIRKEGFPGAYCGDFRSSENPNAPYRRVTTTKDESRGTITEITWLVNDQNGQPQLFPDPNIYDITVKPTYVH